MLVDNEPGQGPGLHLHPYPETWVVRAGRALVTADEEEIEAGPGDVVVVEPNTPHCFRNLGPGRLEIVCIQAAGRMITEWLDDVPTASASARATNSSRWPLQGYYDLSMRRNRL